MRSKDSMLRLHRFKVEDKRRQLAEIEFMISDMQVKARELDQQIALEEKRTGVTDVKHFNYSTTAKSIRTRGENLQKSVGELIQQMDVIRAELEEEEAELRKIELLAQKSGESLPDANEPAPVVPNIGVPI